MKQRGQAGFTLVEVIVVAGIIAVLAGILVPLIFKEIDESKKSKAQADIKSVSSAIMTFRKDAGVWPSLLPNCVDTATLLVSNGNLDDAKMGFTAMGFDSTSALKLTALSENLGGCYSNWAGPYMATVTADPWGNAYLINSAAFIGGGSVWILSAGPNGLVETNVADSVAMNDDIALRLQ